MPVKTLWRVEALQKLAAARGKKLTVVRAYCEVEREE